MTEISNQSDPKLNHAQVFDDVLEDSEDEHGEEAEDSFPVDSMISTVSDGHQFLFDMGSLSLVSDRDRRETGSIAATDLASSMGSVMLRYHDAFLKDIVFFKDMSRGWSIKFEKSTMKEKRSRYAKPRLVIQSLGGVFSCSRLKIGDCLESINGEKVNESTLDPDLVMDHMSECLNEDGFLSVATADKEFGDEILIQSTIIKPRPDMTYEEMGMKVWFWGILCVHKIKKDSPFSRTILRETDHILSINDIKCDKLLKPEQFAEIVNTLPFDITLTVLRRKQRWTGAFK